MAKSRTAGLRLALDADDVALEVDAVIRSDSFSFSRFLCNMGCVARAMRGFVAELVGGVVGLLQELEDGSEESGVEETEVAAEDEEEELAELESSDEELEDDEVGEGSSDGVAKGGTALRQPETDRLTEAFGPSSPGNFGSGTSWGMGEPSLDFALSRFVTSVASPSNHSPTTLHHSTRHSSRRAASSRNTLATPHTFGFASIRSSNRSLDSTRSAACLSISGGGGVSVSSATSAFIPAR